MCYSSLLQRFILLTLLIGSLISLTAHTSAAQVERRYTDRVISSVNATNTSSATGHTPTTQATLSPPAVSGAAALRLGFPSRNPAGSKAGIVVNSGGLLTLAALNGLVINTYMEASSTPQETVQLNKLLTLQVANSGPAAAEFTTTKPFDHLELAAGGLLNAYSLGLVEAYADVVGPLPVELVAFQGKATPAGVQLNWQTASELHNAYFVVERAASNNATAFAELGRVAGKGSSNQSHSYQFIDATSGTIGYYRLRQVDTDGQVHYSPVVVVQAAPVAGLTAYPNPATSTLFITSPVETHFSLLNYQGQPLRQITLAAGQQSLDINSLPVGIYYLRDAATGQSTRFVKVSGQ